MLYVLYGNDQKKARRKMHALTRALIKKKPNASMVQINSETFKLSLLDDCIEGQGLFEAKEIIVLDTIFENKEAKEAVISRRKEIGASPNIFFLLTGDLDKTTLGKLERVAKKIEHFGEQKQAHEKAKPFNVFALGDALGSRERKGLWGLLLRARCRNLSDEEIHGILFWQTKNMLLARATKSASEAGLNPFVYRKAVSSSKNYSESELKILSRTLVSLVHDARRGKYDFATALERFVLNI